MAKVEIVKERPIGDGLSCWWNIVADGAYIEGDLFYANRKLASKAAEKWAKGHNLELETDDGD